MAKPKLVKESHCYSNADMIWILRRHIPDVAAIEQDVFPCPWNEDDFIAFLRQRNAIGLVYQIDRTVVGYVLYSLHKRRIHIENIAVARHHWKQGIGRKMINRLYEKLSQQRRSVLSCDVSERNTDAHLFLNACGFTCRRVIHNHYSNGSDAYLFYRMLTETELGQE
jgi:[ribosomal protein S18]-alanine N-acetyltransferase